jgi:TonB family protein
MEPWRPCGVQGKGRVATPVKEITMTRDRFAFPLAVAIVAFLGVPMAAQQVVRVGGSVRAPRMVRHVDPVYPEEAKAAGVSGVVIIDIKIGTDGSVAAASVLRSIPQLNQAALDAVYQWEFEPTVLNGEPVEVLMTVTVNFTLK